MEDVVKGDVIESRSSKIARPDQSVPTIIEQAGNNARYAWDEFFAIDNDHTRTAYRSAVLRFLDWCEQEGRELASVMPGDVARYLKQLVNLRTGKPSSNETKLLHLSAIRHFFDVLVLRHAALLNPASSVRGPRVGSNGKTPPIPEIKVRELVASINVKTIVGLRDRAVIGVLLYTAARRGAVARLRMKDLWTDGVQYFLRLHDCTF